MELDEEELFYTRVINGAAKPAEIIDYCDIRNRIIEKLAYRLSAVNGHKKSGKEIINELLNKDS